MRGGEGEPDGGDKRCHDELRFRVRPEPIIIVLHTWPLCALDKEIWEGGLGGGGRARAHG